MKRNQVLNLKKSSFSMVNKRMENKKKHGGARPGAGRKRGSVDRVTINGLLETLADKTGDRPYEDLLVEDFLAARINGDTQLVHKYHSLFMSKLMNNLTKVEVQDNRDTIESKQAAFAEALAKLTGVAEKQQ